MTNTEYILYQQIRKSVQYRETPLPEAIFLDEIQTKVVRVTLLSISPLQLCLQVSITTTSSSSSRFLFLPTHTTSYVFLQNHAAS